MIPMPGKIIVKQDSGSEKRGSILVSERFAEKDRPMMGTVLAVGPGKFARLTKNEIHDRLYYAHSAIDTALEIIEAERQALPVSVKVGDRVVFAVYAGQGIEWTDGSMCRCVTEDDLLARIE